MLYPKHAGGREKYVVRLAEEWGQDIKLGLYATLGDIIGPNFKERYAFMQFDGFQSLPCFHKLCLSSQLYLSYWFIITRLSTPTLLQHRMHEKESQ